MVSREARLLVVLVFNLALISGLVAVGIVAHSLGVLAAGGDYVADGLAIGVSLLAIRLGHRAPTAQRPHGYARATALAALLNGSFLLIVTVVVIAEGLRRLVGGTGVVHGIPVAIASGIAAVVMLIGAVVLMGDAGSPDDHDGDRENMRAVLLDTVADAAAAAGAGAAGVVIALTGGHYWLDPVVAIAISAVVGYHAVALLRDVTATLRAL